MDGDEVLGYCLITVFLLTFLGFLMLFGFTIYSDLKGDFKEVKVEVNCYDKYGNEIIGTTCIDEKTCSTNNLPTFYMGCDYYNEGKFANSMVGEEK